MDSISVRSQMIDRVEHRQRLSSREMIRTFIPLYIVRIRLFPILGIFLEREHRTFSTRTQVKLVASKLKRTCNVIDN